MTKEQAVNYLKSSGFSSEAVAEIILALTSNEELLDFAYMIDIKNGRIDFVFSDNTQKHCRIGALKEIVERYDLDYGCTESEGDINMMTLKELLDKIDIKLDKIDISGKRKMLIRCDYDTYIQTPERMPYLNNIVTRWYLDCLHGKTTLFVTVDRTRKA